ncbi:hypothetical protein [Rhodobacter maris]|uniref:Uncharacterized protein n=1 Tax=Rhodobacter maris TaxID=446682 RepID=A0A285RFN6_9RHOB|nr:hypothetical protein [Rhodobacter maris]SOB92923.1 hypothetical protein SAMN05877831_10179 [Rhodobacter maris]
MRPSRRYRPRVNPEEEFSPFLIWGGGAAFAVALAVLFWLLWKSQFTAPVGYLFDTPDLGAEAGYCLSVAQKVVPTGAPEGSFYDEAAQFWIRRLRGLDMDMGAAIARGRGKLARDSAAVGDRAPEWGLAAMERCARRAINYGAHFRAFE